MLRILERNKIKTRKIGSTCINTCMLIGCSFELQTEVLCIGAFRAQIAQHIRTFGTVLIPTDSASDQELIILIKMDCTANCVIHD